MVISLTRQEYLNWLRSTCISDPIVTFFETLFLGAIFVARWASLLCDATDFFSGHWTGAKGRKITVFAHGAVEVLMRAAAK